MEYTPRVWSDHVLSDNKFNIEKNDDGTYTITPHGSVIQQGTPMSAENFNYMEQGIYGNSEDIAGIIASITNILTTLGSKANSEDVYTIDETDAKIIAKVAEIVAGAPADFDTLKEMSDWIYDHKDSAAKMNEAINTNKTNIATLQVEIGNIQTVLESVVEVV